LNTALQKLHEQLYKATQVPQVFERESGRAAFMRRIQKEPELREVIDEACEQFAQTGALPLADSEAGFYVLDRFAEASHCGRIMGDFAHMDGPWLRWLLIDYWQLAGVLRWRDRLNLMQTD
jgi:hypothetical protein